MFSTLYIALLLAGTLSVGGEPPSEQTVVADAKKPIAVEKKVSFKTKAPRQSEVSSVETSSLGGGWAALRNCESGGDYGNKRNPTYRGAYQFSYSTWQSVGGTGDPADASPSEQDARAKALYERSGAGQWPVCGGHLG